MDPSSADSNPAFSASVAKAAALVGLLSVATAALGGFLPILDGGDDQQRSNSGGLPFRMRL